MGQNRNVFFFFPVENQVCSTMKYFKWRLERVDVSCAGKRKTRRSFRITKKLSLRRFHKKSFTFHSRSQLSKEKISLLFLLTNTRRLHNAFLLFMLLMHFRQLSQLKKKRRQKFRLIKFLKQLKKRFRLRKAACKRMSILKSLNISIFHFQGFASIPRLRFSGRKALLKNETVSGCEHSN